MQLPRRSSSTALAARRGGILKTDDKPIEALTAAAIRSTPRKSGALRRLLRPWQAQALTYYDDVGECWNAAQFYSRSLKQIRIFPATRDENGEIVEVTDNPDVQDEVARIQDPGGGGYSRFMDAYGRIMFLIGEGYVLITNPDGDDEGWEFVSPDELRINGEGSYTRFAAPSLPAEQLHDIPDDSFEPLGEGVLVFRLWRPHPRWSLLADSPIRAVLTILEELVLLTLAVRGTAKSRLVRNGILYVPDEISPPPLEAVGDEDMSLDPFLEQLQTQLLAGIVNPGTAAAVAPAIMRGAAEWGAAIRWIQVSNPLETYPEEGLRTEAIRRFATGIEMPSEILTGTADVNHWGAWLIDDQAAKQYVFPFCQQLCDDLTSVFLRPALKAAGVANWNEYVIGYDASAVVAKPDRTATWKDAHDRLVVSDASYREAIDATEQDAPDQAEWERRAAVKMNDPDALTIPYSAGGPDRADDQLVGTEGAPETETDASQGAPERPETPPAENLAARRGHARGAAAAALARARELAGNRLRTAIRNKPADEFAVSLTEFDQLAAVQNPTLARALGPDWVRAHAGRSELALVAGAGSAMLESLQAIGVNGEIGSTLAGMVETHAARTLYLPPAKELPATIVAYIDRVIR